MCNDCVRYIRERDEALARVRELEALHLASEDALAESRYLHANCRAERDELRATVDGVRAALAHGHHTAHHKPPIDDEICDVPGVAPEGKK